MNNTVELWEKTIGQQLEEVAARYPDDEAIAFTDRDYRRTWREFSEETDRIARGLMALGIGKGDHVAIWATNVPEWMMTFFATVKIGAVAVTVNTAYKVHELEYLLTQSDTKLLVMIDRFKKNDYVEIINELIPNLAEQTPGALDIEALPCLKTIVFAGNHEGSENGTPAGMINFSSLYDLAEQTPVSQLDALKADCTCEDISNMQYTSGTTGFPKGVMLTHKNILNNGRFIGDCMKFTHDDKLCITVPFFHCFGMVLAMMACITHATAMVPIDIFSPIKCLRAIEDEGCTAFHGVPTMYIAMLARPEFPEFKLPRLRTGIMAGSPCPLKTMQEVIDRMHMTDITITYGQTEASPGCTMSRTEDSIEKRVETVGRDLPGCENRIVDPETGEELPDGVQGEFVTRGYHVMKGYYKMPEATALAIRDGWLHTGDLAVRDSDGYYRITGRIKDMIIRGGENIYPKEIEDFIYTHPRVKDVQVVGVHSKVYGEEVCACVIPADGETLTEDEIKDFVMASMARHKVPSYVWLVSEFPMNAAGKIQKFKLRDLANDHFGLREEAHHA
ncbi:MAG: AMP-binding protein [Ruminococcaceae bacterium]|nr:AMP-binding protein [Oscillospiraceae bacterium]